MSIKLFGGGSNTKAIGIDDFFEYLESVKGGGDARKFYSEVAWIFRGVNLRASALGRIPYAVYHNDDEVDFPIPLSPLLKTTEADLVLSGAGYWLKRAGRMALNDLQRLNPWVTSPVVDSRQGITGFEYQVDGSVTEYGTEQIVYFDHYYNPADDLGPGIAPSQVAGVPSDLVRYMNNWAAKFFERGAIPAVILQTESVLREGEQEAIQNMWQKFVGGIGRAWRAMVLQRGLEAEIVGMPVKDLAMPELDRRAKEQIAAALGVPIGLLEKGSMNRATFYGHQESFYTETIIPEAEAMQEIINNQLMGGLGLELRFDYGSLEVIQRMESEKAQSTASIMRETNAAVSSGILDIDEARGLTQTLLGQMGLPALSELEAIAEPIDDQEPDEEPSEEVVEQFERMSAAYEELIAKDLDLFQRIAVREIEGGNNPGDYSYTSDYVPPEDIKRLRQSLSACYTKSDVVGVFRGKQFPSAIPGKRRRFESNLSNDILTYFEDLQERVVDAVEESGARPRSVENGA